MSTLYRSPNVIIDAHEWHLAVEDDSRLSGNRFRRPVIRYKWRIVSAKSVPWKTITEWIGPMPKRFAQKYMKPYRRHAELALRDQAARAEAIKRLSVPRVPSTAELHNI